jgi:hypothetical protein
MDLEKRVQVLEFAYAGVLADAVQCFAKEGVLEKVTEEKKKVQMALGKQQADRYGVQKPEEVFTKLSEVFNCASWEINTEGDGFIAEAKTCKLCAIAKKMGTNSPCYIYCLNPMEGMVKGISPNSTYEVMETIWDGQKCRVAVK